MAPSGGTHGESTAAAPDRTIPHVTEQETLRAAVLAVGGGIWGLVSDRVAARWPAHADGHVRAVDWRTMAVALSGALAFAGRASRWGDPRDVAVLGVYFAALILLLATDLDQKLLPDAITLPLIPFALVVLLLGWDPLLAGKGLGLVSGLVAGIGAPAALILTSRLFGGGIGMGDIKLAVSLGLMSGIYLFIAGFLVASIVFAALLLVLMATRRVGLKSAIPFGPILIAGGILGALLPPL
jgi:leader peptidase (prepilin peptidase)/N-methyltransferase